MVFEYNKLDPHFFGGLQPQDTFEKENLVKMSLIVCLIFKPYQYI